MNCKTLDSETFEIIRREVVPQARWGDDPIVLADWCSILETAAHLGINVDIQVSKLEKEVLKQKPDFDMPIVISLDGRREILTILDRCLGATRLQEFEDMLDRLRKLLDRKELIARTNTAIMDR